MTFEYPELHRSNHEAIGHYRDCTLFAFLHTFGLVFDGCFTVACQNKHGLCYASMHNLSNKFENR